MSAEIIPFPTPTPPAEKRPWTAAELPAAVRHCRILHGQEIELLEIRLILRTDDVPPDQRHPLVNLLRCGKVIRLTLEE